MGAVRPGPRAGRLMAAALHVVHLMASPFFGGPERQMLGLAQHLAPAVRSTFLSFAERGLARAFLDRAQQAGYDAHALTHNVRHAGKAVAEIAGELRDRKADLLTTSGYKPDVLGWRAARKAGVPVVAVAHGWTGATWKVRVNEALDRLVLRWTDAVVCVSAAQAAKVRRALVPGRLIHTIPNAVGDDAFAAPDPAYRDQLRGLFPQPPRRIVGAAGRLSPEKGFAVLVDAAARVRAELPDVGVVVFGDGPLRADLEAQIARLNLNGHVVLAGFRPDVLKFLPHLDVAAMPSYTEGLPIALLETCAAGVPTVASAVGGIPEVLTDGQTGHLVAPGNAGALAERLAALLRDDAARQRMGAAARERVRTTFSFAQTVGRYRALFDALVARRPTAPV